jgi:N-methylhydantoinase B
MNLIHQFVQNAVQDFESAACITEAGEVLGLKYENVADIGTLGPAGITAIKYFSPQMGDVVLLNDPYSGGTLLSMLTLVTPLNKNNASIPNLYLVIRTGFRAHLTLSSRMEEEGLRIPPTPIAAKRELNSMILGAIQENSLAPQELQERIKSVLNIAWKHIDNFQLLLRGKSPSLLNEKALQDWLDISRRQMSLQLSECPTGESRSDTRLDSGELIRLRVALSPQSVLFDFSGTSTSKRVCLTDAATLGACFGGLAAFLPKPVPMNSGTFSLLNVVSPLGCLLNAKFPSPTFRGMTEGCAQVAGAVVKTLGDIMPQRRVALSAQAPVQIGLEFNPQQRFFDAIAGGSGASASQAGEDGVLLWVRNSLRNSVQEIETRFPLRIENISVRKNSGGQGLFNGGNGLVKSYRILAPAKLTWLLPSKLTPFGGQNGGESGKPPEIEVIRASGTKELLTSEEGFLQLSTQDTLIIKSPGGGGFGSAKT